VKEINQESGTPFAELLDLRVGWRFGPARGVAVGCDGEVGVKASVDWEQASERKRAQSSEFKNQSSSFILVNCSFNMGRSL